MQSNITDAEFTEFKRILWEQVEETERFRSQCDSLKSRARYAEFKLQQALKQAQEREKPCVWTKIKTGKTVIIAPGCNGSGKGFITKMEYFPLRFCPNCGHPFEVAP